MLSKANFPCGFSAWTLSSCSGRSKFPSLYYFDETDGWQLRNTVFPDEIMDLEPIFFPNFLDIIPDYLVYDNVSLHIPLEETRNHGSEFNIRPTLS